jgi:hypothetical protein
MRLPAGEVAGPGSADPCPCETVRRVPEKRGFNPQLEKWRHIPTASAEYVAATRDALSLYAGLYDG